MSSRILVVGYGNVARQDDGAGVHVAERIRLEKLPGVTVATYHQLNIELLEELDPYASVILIDAGQQEEDVVLGRIKESARERRPASSHHLSPELFVQMARTIYHRALRLFVCSIRAEHFELDDAIRPELEPRLRRAQEMVLNLIRKEQEHA